MNAYVPLTPNPYVEILHPGVTVSGGEAFGRGVDHEGRVLIERPERASWPPPPYETREKALAMTQEGAPSSSLQNCEK